MEIFETVKSIYIKLGELGINYQIVMMILLGGLFAQAYCNAFTHIGPFKIDMAWRTLIIGTGFVILLIIAKAITGNLQKDIVEEYFISYIFSTSLYEILLKKWFNKVLEKLGILNQKS